MTYLRSEKVMELLEVSSARRQHYKAKVIAAKKHGEKCNQETRVAIGR
jgi:hypothetical protein